MIDQENNVAHLFNEYELNILCHKWQRLLQLTDWDIIVRVTRSSKMDRTDVLGTNSFAISNHKSLINILDPQDYPNSPFEYDMEVCLVHELLHLPVKYFAEPEEDTLESFMMESFIEKMAFFLVEQQRKIDKLENENFE